MNLHETITKLKTNPDHESIQSSIQFLVELDRIASALDEHMVVSHLGVFNIGTDPKYILNLLACYEQAYGEYFAKERIKELEIELKIFKNVPTHPINLRDKRIKELEAELLQCSSMLNDAERTIESLEDAQNKVVEACVAACGDLADNWDDPAERYGMRVAMGDIRAQWKKFLPQQ